MAYQPTDVVTTEEEVQSGFAPIKNQQAKIIDHVDELCRLWIERSPFLVMSTVDKAGRLDVSPKGDPAGFVKVIDRQTLAIPDRPGNHRFDSLRNILATGRIGLVFFVPNRTEVVRVNGSAQVVRDQGLREKMAIKDRVPHFAILVRVEEAFYHCGKAVVRSGLWSPERAVPVEGLPSYAQAIVAHANVVDLSLEEIERRIKHNDDHRLYDE